MDEKDDNDNDKTITIEQYDWSLNEFIMIKSTYERLSINSARLLENAKSCKLKESIMQYLIVILGLSSSFVSALPGINDVIRTYITSSFTLLTAIIGGWMSKKTYGQKSGKYYSAYQEYKDVIASIDNILVSLKCDRTYETFNYHISKIESKYEIFLPIDIINVAKITTECRLKFKTVEDRFLQLEHDKLNEKYKIFMDRKSYIYLHECKLKMYRSYVYKAKIKDKIDTKNLMDCYSYENYCRIHYPEKFKMFTKVYDEFVNAQLSRYYKGTGEYDSSKIEIELSTKKLMTETDVEFSRQVHEKFSEYQNVIKQYEYQEDEKEETINENYSLE